MINIHLKINDTETTITILLVEPSLLSYDHWSKIVNSICGKELLFGDKSYRAFVNSGFFKTTFRDDFHGDYAVNLAADFEQWLVDNGFIS